MIGSPTPHMTTQEPQQSAARGTLRWVALLLDLMTLFWRGPVAIVLGDTRSQLKRERVELKRRLGLRLTPTDLANVLEALQGIDSSRRYVLGYSFIYEYFEGRLSAPAKARLGQDAIYPPTEELIELTKNFDVARIPRTVAFLERATRGESAAADDLGEQWERAIGEDDAGAYRHFTRSAWRLIYTVGIKAPASYLPRATASIRRVQSYILATSAPGLSYYDVVAGAPKLLRATIYAADANHRGHALDGAHIPYPVEASKDAARTLDGYLTRVLGESQAAQHVLFSENRERVEAHDPLDVQASFERSRAVVKQARP